jgi:hypothetical protein
VAVVELAVLAPLNKVSQVAQGLVLLCLVAAVLVLSAAQVSLLVEWA